MDNVQTILLELLLDLFSLFFAIQKYLAKATKESLNKNG